ncbi:MAG: hypothetical protein K2X38_09175 [Gemmataceae bacterium]|nr:hypothetical protein [Gemmataceae bacterium]
MRTTLALALGAMLAFSGVASAQPGGFGKKGKDFGPREGGGVEVELRKLREKVRELEAKVNSAKDEKKSDKKDFARAGQPEKKGFGRGGFGPGGFGKMDPEKMKQMMERFKEMKKGEGKEAAKGKDRDGKKGPPPWAKGKRGEGERKMGPGGFGRPGFGPHGKDGERRFGPGGFGRGPGAPVARSEARRLDDLETKVDEILRLLRNQRGRPSGRGR